MTSPLHGEGPRFKLELNPNGKHQETPGGPIFLTMNTYYDQIAEGYDELHKEEQLKKIAIIQTLLKKHKLLPTENQTLLDVGCGTGISTRCWQAKATGIDPSKKLIEIARLKEDRCTYLIGKAEQLPFPDNSFDIVISITVIHNFSDIEQGLKEIQRVGKNCYVLTFLKKTQHAQAIKKIIYELFHVLEETEEEKDLIFILS